MKEVPGNLWDYVGIASHLFITTNLDVNARYEAVMGAGVAGQAKKNWPELPRILGEQNVNGVNVPVWLKTVRDTELWSFPTKGDHTWTNLDVLPKYQHKFSASNAPGWARLSSIYLIETSTKHIANRIPNITLGVITWPGCGNGGLNKDRVRGVLMEHLDGRFTIVG